MTVSEEQLRALYEAARSAWQRGDRFRARTDLETILQQHPQGRLLGASRLLYGVVLREAGDTSVAIEQLERFLGEMDQQYPDLAPVCRGYGLYNLGLAQRQNAYRAGGDPDTERLRDAVRTYLQAADEFRREGPKWMLRDTLQNLAWAACCGNVPTYAIRALDESEPLCDTSESKWQQRIGRAHALATGGDVVEGIELCEVIMRGENVPADVRSHAAWIAGHAALLLGQLTEADDLANQAVHWGAEAKDHRCLNDAANLRRRVSEAQAEHRERTGA